MGLKAVIFDMDGVIVDTEPEYQRVEMELVSRIDSSVTTDVLKKYTGINPIIMWSHIKDKFDLPRTAEELYEEEERMMQEYYEKGELKVIDPIVRLIKDVYEKGYKTGVASSSERTNIDKVLERLDIKRYFNVIVSNNDVERCKPHPDIYLLAAKRLQVKEYECLVIEDSVAGVASAKAAGMKVVRFYNGNKKHDEKADHLVQDMKELTLSVLENIFED